MKHTDVGPKKKNPTCFHNDTRVNRRRLSGVRCGWKKKKKKKKQRSVFNVEVSERFLKLQQRLHRQPCSVCLFLNTRFTPFKPPPPPRVNSFHLQLEFSSRAVR